MRVRLTPMDWPQGSWGHFFDVAGWQFPHWGSNLVLDLFGEFVWIEQPLGTCVIPVVHTFGSVSHWNVHSISCPLLSISSHLTNLIFSMQIFLTWCSGQHLWSYVVTQWGYIAECHVWLSWRFFPGSLLRKVKEKMTKCLLLVLCFRWIIGAMDAVHAKKNALDEHAKIPPKTSEIVSCPLYNWFCVNHKFRDLIVIPENDVCRESIRHSSTRLLTLRLSTEIQH